MNALLRFAAERMPARRYLPLAALFALLGGAAPRLSLSVGTAWLMLFTLRLRDDLATLPSDRNQHPQRALCLASARDLMVMVAVFAGSALVTGLLLAWTRRPVNAGLFLVLLLVFELAYRLTQNESRHWVLIKYAFFPLILQNSLWLSSGAPDASVLWPELTELVERFGSRAGWQISGVTLCGMLVFEWGDDAVLKQRASMPLSILLFATCGLALGLAGLMERLLSATALVSKAPAPPQVSPILGCTTLGLLLACSSLLARPATSRWLTRLAQDFQQAQALTGSWLAMAPAIPKASKGLTGALLGSALVVALI